MKILAIAFVYNELPYLPDAIRYYQQQGCEIYVVDNYSTDGTWEWLQAHNIPSHRFDTCGAFHLEWLQTEMISTVHLLKPDWFIWFAPDLFHVFDSSIHDVIVESSQHGYNQITSPCFSFKNTGECFNIPLARYYRYAHCNNATTLISQYHPSLHMYADRIIIPQVNKRNIGTILEYGGCKPTAVQEEKLRRRQLAWTLGTPKGHGVHYLEGKKREWVYDPSTLVDVWDSPHFEMVKKLLSLWH